MVSMFGVRRGLLILGALGLLVLTGHVFTRPSERSSLDLPTFKEMYRPQFHYTPRRNWMNDPNGLVYHDGTYHLFHQYNPAGTRWGHMSWYHATSSDLVHWSHEGVAIPEEGNEMIFSGSAVVDHRNTAGFGDADGPAPIVAIYTSHYTLPGDSIDQAQSLAYSVDGGETWTKYEGNPVLDHPNPDFRDPNVFWYEPEEKWVMSVALSEERVIRFYQSTDLKNWTHLSDFGPAGATNGIWECPALFRVPVEGTTDRSRWVLQVDVGSHSIAGGSGAQYFVGRFDGTSFTREANGAAAPPRWIDYGPDFYAAIPWRNVPDADGRALWLGWMNDWRYAQEIPTSPWRSAQTIPRSVELRTIDGTTRLVQTPVKELHTLRGDHVRLTSQPLRPGTMSLSDRGISGKSMELTAVFEPGTAQTVGLNVRVGETERTTVGYDVDSETVFVDRTGAGTADFHDEFAARNEAPLSLQDDRVELHVLVDWSSVEVFANDGARVLTHRIFPDSGSDGISLVSTGGIARLVRLDAWHLQSVWENR